MTPQQLGPTFARNLKALRNAKGWSQQDLAAKLKSAASIVSLWESGKTSPTLATVTKLCVVFGVHPEDLLGDGTARILETTHA